jgi:hypothetical protein
MAAIRAEIQALRALAVALVVAYHLWPAAVPAGFVGVDVFFVISGFSSPGCCCGRSTRRAGCARSGSGRGARGGSCRRRC